MNRREILKSAGLLAGAASAQVAIPTQKRKIVVVGGHPGDPEYGCGGTVARFTALGHDVVLMYMNNGAWETSAPVRTSEARKASGILKAHPVWVGQQNGHAIIDNEHYKAFQQLLEAEKPDAVFNHWPIDNHPDHRGIANLTYEAWKQVNRRFAMYYYEISDGEDTTQFGNPTHYVDISEVLEIKKAACYAHASQKPDFYYELQDTVAHFRGLQSGCRRAEAFIRQIGSPFDVFSMAGLPVL